MKLIKKLGTKLSKSNRLVSCGEFLCSECNKIVERQLSNGLRDISCGCNRHRESDTRLYVIWESMKTRILNPNSQAYKDYGGRGITICPEWTNDYTKFRDWSLSNGYANNLEIDRIETNGNYEPNNCQWITHKENMRKTRRIKLTMKIANEIRELDATEKYTRKELAIKYKVHRSTISLIIHNKLWENI